MQVNIRKCIDTNTCSRIKLIETYLSYSYHTKDIKCLISKSTQLMSIDVDTCMGALAI